MRRSCNTTPNQCTGVALFLEESSHVYIILDNPFKFGSTHKKASSMFWSRIFETLGLPKYHHFVAGGAVKLLYRLIYTTVRDKCLIALRG